MINVSNDNYFAYLEEKANPKVANDESEQKS